MNEDRLYRIAPKRNMYRRYLVSIEPALFGVALVRNFGRIGRSGRHLIELYETLEAAEAARQNLLRQKLRRGYRPG